MSSSKIKFIYIGGRNGDIVRESLSLYLDITRGRSKRGFDLIPLKAMQDAAKNDWRMATSVISQLLSLHTIHHVDGVHKFLSGSDWSKVAHYTATHAKYIKGLIESPSPVYYTLSNKEVSAVVCSLNLVCSLRLGSLSGLFELLPYDYTERLNYEWLTEWTITKYTISRIVSQFTIDNVDGINKTLFPSHSFFQNHGMETLEVLEEILKTKRDGGETVLLSL